MYRTSFSLVVIKRIVQRFDEKWLIWGRNVESELLLGTLNPLSLNSSEPQFPHLENGNHYNKLVEALKIKWMKYLAQDTDNREVRA